MILFQPDMSVQRVDPPSYQVISRETFSTRFSLVPNDSQHPAIIIYSHSS
jgi:hypothetical protein